MISIRTWALRTLISGTIVLASCGFKKTDSGVEYKIVEDKDGPKVEAGGFVELTLNYYNEADSFKSAQRGGPIQIPMPDSLRFKHSIEAVLLTLTEGDSVLIRMNSDSLYKNIFNSKPPKGMDEDSKTTFEIRVVKAYSKDSLRRMQEAYQAEQQAAIMKRQMQMQADTVAIKEYLTSKKIKAKRTLDGVYYVITKKQEGLELQPGDTANTFYAGRLLDGTAFDSNFGKDPFPVVIGESQVIRGWHSCLMKMKKGEKGTFYIPSVLAYGDQAAGDKIPPNSILVFDIEVAK